ncbi:NmrA family NAD(P)-binding protein [Rhizobium sp. 2YAF20]|uniref:NmrA family NAD(P)-binding protein n=1 Tax=Rhizobium sp. 2YAF20 TaxID=3233027 RepID=UPI003F94BA38
MQLVTGAAGMNGRTTVAEFVGAGLPVRALVRSAASAVRAGLNRIPGVEVVEGDMMNVAIGDAVLDGVERVLMISSGAPDMVETQCRFVDSCRKAGVQHVIKFSGAESGIGFDPSKFRFTRMHEEIEDYLEASGVAWTHVRPSQFMQVYLREAPDITARNMIRLPFADITLSPVDARDIAKVNFNLLRMGGHEMESLDMTGPEALTMADVAERISIAIGRKVTYKPITPEERRGALLASGVPAGFVDALDEQLIERLKRPESKVDLATHQAFGVRPTTFVEFAADHAAAFRGESVAR